MSQTNPVKIPGTVITTLKVSDIEVGERFRKDYGELRDLMHSIRTQGLINPITVVEQSGIYHLAAGGRRLRAIQEIGMEEVQVRIYSDGFDELDLRILELAENIHRKDMTWMEQNNLQREIHRLQQEKYGISTPGGTKSLPEEERRKIIEAGERLAQGWRMEDTANMLGVSRTRVQESITMADKFDKYKNILGDPNQYKNESDARKAIKVVEESIVRAELAKRAAKKAGTSPLQRLSERYNVGDALDGLEQIPPESIAFMEIDPPYGIDLDLQKLNNPCENYTEIDQDYYVSFNLRILKAAYSALMPDSYCVYWFGIDPWIEILYKLAQSVGFTGSRIPMIWVKPAGQSLQPDRRLASAYEAALIFIKGKPVLAKPGRINVFSYTPVPANKKVHPTQKPIELYQDIYQTFSFENANCCSPFLGSGASIIAADLSKRTSFGWDLSQENKDAFLKLVNDTYLLGDMNE